MKNSQMGFAPLAIVLIVAGILVVGGAGYWFYQSQNQTPQLIGGQKDEHGCLGPAGYSWCEVKQKCLRVWEEACTETSTTGIKNDVGYKVTGYYTSFLGEAWDEKKQCDSFVITGGDQEFIKHFSDTVTNGNTVNQLDSSGQLIFDLNLVDVSKNDSILIKDSNITSPVTLTISIPRVNETEAPVCFSFGKIISVEK